VDDAFQGMGSLPGAKGRCAHPLLSRKPKMVCPAVITDSEASGSTSIEPHEKAGFDLVLLQRGCLCRKYSKYLLFGPDSGKRASKLVWNSDNSCGRGVRDPRGTETANSMNRLSNIKCWHPEFSKGSRPILRTRVTRQGIPPIL